MITQDGIVYEFELTSGRRVTLDRRWLDFDRDAPADAAEVPAHLGTTADIQADRFAAILIAEAEYRQWKARLSLDAVSKKKIPAWQVTLIYQADPHYAEYNEAIALLKGELRFAEKFEVALLDKSPTARIRIRSEAAGERAAGAGMDAGKARPPKVRVTKNRTGD